MKVPVDGDIYLAALPYEDNIQSGHRPVIIAQNVVGNTYSPTVHIVPLTAKSHKAGTQPTHVLLEPSTRNGLRHNSVALVEDVRPVPKECLKFRIGHLDVQEREAIGKAFRIHIPLAGL